MIIDRNDSSDSHDRGKARPLRALGNVWVIWQGRLDWRAVKYSNFRALKQPDVTDLNSSRSGYNCEYLCEDYHCEEIYSVRSSESDRQNDRMGADLFNLGHRTSGFYPIKILRSFFP
jgi:hypothetical protein